MELKKLFRPKTALFAVVSIAILTAGWVGFCFIYRAMIGNGVKPIHPVEAIASGLMAVGFVIAAEVLTALEVFKE